MSLSEHFVNFENGVGSPSRNDLRKVVLAESKCPQVSHVGDRSDANSAAFPKVKQPQTSESGPCSDSDEFASVYSNDDWRNCALLEAEEHGIEYHGDDSQEAPGTSQNYSSVEAEAEEDCGIENHSDDSQDAAFMPPLPSKLFGNLKSTYESLDKTSMALVATEPDSTQASLDGIFPSADQVEHAKTAVSSTGNEEVFTVMLKNIPCRCSKEDLVELLAARGWGDSYNFFHLPGPKKPSKGFKGSLGYAFIGFSDTATTKRFMQEMKGVKFPGRKSTKELDVAPARFQGLRENLSQLAKKNIRPSNITSLSSKDTLPTSEPDANASKKQQRKRTNLSRDSYEAATVMPAYSWNPMQSALGPSQYMWYQQHEHAPQAYGIEDFCMNMSASGPSNSNFNWYSLSAGHMPSSGTQSFTDHGYWRNPDHDNPEEHMASELESLSPGIESVEDPESEEESQILAQNQELMAACSDSGFECTEIADDDDEELLTVMMKNIPCRCSQEEVLDLLAAHGWADAYNFFHLPAPPRTCKGWKGCLGYAFIGFPNSSLTRRFMQEMKGVSFSTRKSAKVIDIAPARHQGLHDNLAHFSGKKVGQSSRAPIYRSCANSSEEMCWKMSF